MPRRRGLSIRPIRSRGGSRRSVEDANVSSAPSSPRGRDPCKPPHMLGPVTRGVPACAGMTLVKSQPYPPLTGPPARSHKSGLWARGTAVAHSLHTGGVTGSIPVAPTIFSPPRRPTGQLAPRVPTLVLSLSKDGRALRLAVVPPSEQVRGQASSPLEWRAMPRMQRQTSPAARAIQRRQWQRHRLSSSSATSNSPSAARRCWRGRSWPWRRGRGCAWWGATARASRRC